MASACLNQYIFKANASGKSNLIKAMAFGRVMVVKGFPAGQMIDYEKYRLNKSSAESNSRMEFEIQQTARITLMDLSSIILGLLKNGYMKSQSVRRKDI